MVALGLITAIYTGSAVDISELVFSALTRASR